MLDINYHEIMYNNKNLVENYDFTPYNYGHLSYKMGVVAKDMSGYYKEILTGLIARC